MYSLRWNEEDYKRAMQEDAYDEGMEKGLEKGKLDTTIFVVKNMLNMKRPMLKSLRPPACLPKKSPALPKRLICPTNTIRSCSRL